MQNIDQLLQLRKYDPQNPPPPDTIILRIENKNIASLGNFITITGMPKQGKGKFIAGMLAAALSNTEIFGMKVRLPEDRKKVCLFDTDQAGYEFHKNIQLIKSLANIYSYQNIDAYNVREDEAKDIVSMIECYLEANKDCSLIVIDNIADLLFNYNDEAQSKRVINFLKKATKKYNVLAVPVLHLGKNNSTTIGHLGALNDRYAQTVLRAEKMNDRSSFILKLDYSRSAGEFTPLEIYYDEQADTWRQTSYLSEETNVRPLKKKPAEYDISVHQDNCRRIFNASGHIYMPYDSLVQAIKEVYAAGGNWAKECVKYLIEQNIIWRTEAGYTILRQATLMNRV